MVAPRYLLSLFVSLSLTAVSLLVAHTTLKANEWPQFRGPGGQGISSAVGLPQNWSNKNNLHWRVSLPGAGSSSPIALGDRLYVTCYSGYMVDRDNPGRMDDLRLHVLALDQKTGKTLWNREIKPKLPETERVRDHGYAAATPATDGQHLYVFFGKSGVFKLTLDGRIVWNADVGSRTHRWGCGTSPVLFKDLVIVNASVESGSLVALSKKDGARAWSAPGMNRSWNTPHLVEVKPGHFELVVSIKGAILAYDPATGKELWRCRGIQDYVCPSIVSDKGILYAIGGRRSRTIAVRAGGRGDVTESHVLWEANAGANVSSPVVHDGHLYWVSDRSNVAYCLRLSDGEVLYSERFPGQPYASTLLADGKLFVVTRYSGTFVLSPKTKFTQIAHNRFEDESAFHGSPIAVGKRLFLRSDRYLYCVGEKK